MQRLGFVLFLIAVLPIISIYSVYGQAQPSFQPYNLYNTFYTDLSVQALVSAAIPGRGVIAAAGLDTSSGGYFLEILTNSSRFRYALSGAPTAIVSDGGYGSYIAVGTDRGDVVVYNAQTGSISYIQASRYPVKRLSVGVGASGDPYLAVLDSQGYLYLYRASVGGWAEIGPLGGDVVYSFTRASVLDISGAEVVASGQRSVDPSLLLAVYKPPSINIRFIVYNETSYPVSGAVITATLASPKTPLDLVYQAVTGQNGTASLSLPLIDPRGTVYNITITHADYETWSLRITLDQGMVDRDQTYMITLKRGLGVQTPIVETPKISYAALIDASGAPKSIGLGRSLLLTIDPIYVKLIKPEVQNMPWRYLGIIAGYRGSTPVIALIYFDQNLDPIPISGSDYVWYPIPGYDIKQVWAGYDDDGKGLLTALDRGKIYYFHYDVGEGRHMIYWSMDLPPITSADYRNGVLIAADKGGMLHIGRINPSFSIECTRTGDYFGVPIGSGVGISIGSGKGFVVTQNRVYMISSLESTASRCPLEFVRISIRSPVEGPTASYMDLGDGYIDIYEGNSLVARGVITNGSSGLFLPRGSYTARVSSTVSFEAPLEVGGSSVLVGPKLYRVNASLYYYSDSPLASTPTRVPPGLTLLIDDKINITTKDEKIELLLEGGAHTAKLLYNGIELARALFNVSGSGDMDIVFRANTARVGVSLSSPDTDMIPNGSVSLRLIADGPLLKGDLGEIRPEVLSLPLGFYRIVASSPFFYDREISFTLTSPGTESSLEILLRPKSFQARITVTDDLGQPVPGAGVIILDKSGGVIFTGATDSGGVASIPRIFLGEYLITIRPNATLYTGYSGPLKVDRQDLVVAINRTRWNLTIIFNDQISGSIAEPVRIAIYVENALVYLQNVSPGMRSVNITAPYGSARIVVEPVGEGSIYNRTEASVKIGVGGGQVVVTLQRRFIEYNISVVNDLGQPIQGASVSIRSVENPSIEVVQLTDSRGRAVFKVPVGAYSVVASAPGYERLSSGLPPSGNIVLTLKPTLQSLLMRYMFIFMAAAFVIATIIAARILTGYMKRKVSEEVI